MAQWKFVEWLLFWLLYDENFVFDWDKGNIRKNSDKHNVTTEEAESVFLRRRALPLGLEVQSQNWPEVRFGIIGEAFNGKVLFVVFVLRKSKVRIISARPTNKKERSKYEESIRQIIKDL